jgi:hypothetical protein
VYILVDQLIEHPHLRARRGAASDFWKGLVEIIRMTETPTILPSPSVGTTAFG